MNILGRSRGGVEPDEDDRVFKMHVYRRYAARAIADERWAAAEVFLDRMLEVDPRHTEAWLMKGHLYRHCKNDLNAAIECYRKVIVLGGYDMSDQHVRAAHDSLKRLLDRLA